MKKGYIRLLTFDIIFILLFILSGFVSSILSGYIKVLAVIFMLFLFKLFFGFEKDRHRYTKSIFIELVIYFLVYFLLYYLLGILIGFTKVGNYFTINNIVNLMLPLVLTIILKELLRYMMLVKSEGSKLLLVFTTIFFIIFDLAGQIDESIFISTYSVFIFFAITVLPTICMNILCSYISYKSGYKPAMFYFIIKNMYMYFVPIIPNPNEYIYAIIELIVPMIFLYNIHKFFLNDRDDEVLREYHKSKFIPLLIPSFIVIILVYFTSGYFKFHAIAIASGSMAPNLNKGDVVVIEKTNDYKNINEGQILAHKKGNIIVVHRIIKKILVEGKYYYYTKGDANDSQDNYEISEEMVVGIVNIKIPLIGYPTVWLNSL